MLNLNEKDSMGLQSHTAIRCKWAQSSPEMMKYHDTEYGFTISNDILYFERLILELFQAGLSWQTILKKRENFRKVFDNFDFYKIAFYNDEKIAELMDYNGIIRNRLKIKAAIFNAVKFIEIIKNLGSFDNFIKKQQIDDRLSILKMFKSNFKFMGPLIVEEFMMSTGFWKVKHEETCFLHEK